MLQCTGTDEDTILMLLPARNNDQRQEIKAAYKKAHGKVRHSHAHIHSFIADPNVFLSFHLAILNLTYLVVNLSDWLLSMLRTLTEFDPLYCIVFAEVKSDSY